MQVGVAKVELKLPPKIPLAGYSRRAGKPAQGQLDPLSVRALVVGSAEQQTALISIDLLIIDEYLHTAVKHKLAAQGLSPQLFLSATHTHSGPGAYGHRFGEKISMGHFEQAVFDGLVNAMVQAIQQAREQQEPMQISWQQTQVQGWSHNRMQDQGPVDTALTLVSFYRQGHTAPAAVITHFAAHATVLGADNFKFSADYPGALMQSLEAQWPGSVVFFLAGNVADQAPNKKGPGVEAVQALGEHLAQSVKVQLPQAKPKPITHTRAEMQVLDFEESRVRIGKHKLPKWLSRRLVDDDATLTLLAIEDILFIGVPCDMTFQLGEQLKQHAQQQGYRPMVVGFTNDYVGYCISADLYDSDEYEADMAFNGPNAGETIVRTLQTMLESWK